MINTYFSLLKEIQDYGESINPSVDIHAHSFSLIEAVEEITTSLSQYEFRRITDMMEDNTLQFQIESTKMFLDVDLDEFTVDPLYQYIASKGCCGPEEHSIENMSHCRYRIFFQSYLLNIVITSCNKRVMFLQDLHFKNLDTDEMRGACESIKDVIPDLPILNMHQYWSAMVVAQSRLCKKRDPRLFEAHKNPYIGLVTVNVWDKGPRSIFLEKENITTLSKAVGKPILM